MDRYQGLVPRAEIVASRDQFYYQHNNRNNDVKEKKTDIKTLPSVCGSLINRSRQFTKFVPLKGSPPMPTQVD
jgi:hypothetical protein